MSDPRNLPAAYLKLKLSRAVSLLVYMGLNCIPLIEACNDV